MRMCRRKTRRMKNMKSVLAGRAKRGEMCPRWTRHVLERRYPHWNRHRKADNASSLDTATVRH